MDSPENLKEYLAAIVENSDDAIITKNLDSIIQTWNRSAEHMFGFTAEEAIGQPITILIPDDRHHEEMDIIARLRRGERIRHFETVRRRKDGCVVPISLTVSPVRNASGDVIGASKIARDISLQKEAAERQRMLLAEMRHRVGNCFAVAGSLITVSARQVETAGELAILMRGHLLALASAHKLAVADPTGETSGSTSFRELVSSIIEPFVGEKVHDLDIEDVRIAPASITPLALIFYELCTNAIKYGAFSQSDGHLSVAARRRGDRFIIDWRERCDIDPETAHGKSFGTELCHDVAKSALGGTITKHFEATGMRARIDLDPARFAA
ncbi:PAS domain S-box protein [Pikeienuella piscinae]|uniref:histidine kinase n=1 Tax=Pikeienuella piscinae TaxID=2748098 RepID=A0A7M3T5M2_9RHOB|nr:PAS domain S-box protein [Pikeienuella piscinae]QIE57303.1 PAS domain S-box protein [Pikeienuella piscinae]